MAIKTAVELAQRCKEVAQNYKTLYVMGCFGAPLNAANRDRYCSNHSYNRKPTRTVKIKSATASTFGFDCVNLIKGLLWGWDGNTAAIYGGAKYATNSVPDINADAMITKCSGVSTNFSNIQVGEVVWVSGHIGVYIGDGLAVECTPAWKDGVQITAVGNIGKKSGYYTRTWTKHGKLPYVTYEKTKEEPKANKGESVVNIALSVLEAGMEGEQVKSMQILLMGRGEKMPKYGADGDFGDETGDALESFQRKRDLTPDRVCGSQTWTELLKG